MRSVLSVCWTSLGGETAHAAGEGDAFLGRQPGGGAESEAKLLRKGMAMQFRIVAQGGDHLRIQISD
jgi:hypothetical protein